MLKAAQGRRTGQRRDAIDRRLQRQVVAQFAMIIKIFVTERQAVQTLTQLYQRAVTAAHRVPRIPQNPGRRHAQPEAAVGGAHQQHPAVAAHRAARKIDLDQTLATGWKAKTPLATICHRQDPPLDFAYRQNPSMIRGLAVPFSTPVMNYPG
jgi:hypothetical protein